MLIEPRIIYNTIILQIYKEIHWNKFFHLIILQSMAEKVSVILPLYGNPLHDAPLVVVSGQGTGDTPLVRNQIEAPIGQVSYILAPT